MPMPKSDPSPTVPQVSPPTSEHTPGPWLATKNLNGSWGIHTAPNYLPHATVYGRAEHSAKMAEVDARMMAAAPDLLAVCKALQSAWADGEVGDWRGALDDALTMADRAVRKAEGGVA